MEAQHNKPSIAASTLMEAMRHSNMNASALALAAGVSTSTISLILSGKRRSTTVDIATKLARALNVSVDYLIGSWAEPEPIPLMLGGLLVELTRVARSLPLSRQRDLLLIAQAFADESE
jgi:transcriptional regulator with XRE-family HTH domain